MGTFLSERDGRAPTSAPSDYARPLSDAHLRLVARMLAEGDLVFGPAPNTPGNTTPTTEDSIRLPGTHVQVAHGSRMVNGWGATGDDALEDALKRLHGYRLTARTR